MSENPADVEQLKRYLAEAQKLARERGTALERLRQDHAALRMAKQQDVETIAREQRMAEQSRRDAAALSEYVELARPVVEAVRAIQHNRWIWLHNRVSDKDTATQALSDMQREIRALKRIKLPKETL